jgi:hypothetical protein
MRIATVTDAWKPQVNGVVKTLMSTCEELRAMGHEVLTITPLGRRSIPLPTYSEIRISLFPGRSVRKDCRALSEQFSWRRSTLQFEGYLEPRTRATASAHPESSASR